MIYFDPTNPLFLTRDACFDGVPVDVDDGVMDFVEQYTTLLLTMQGRIYESGAAEDFGQGLADEYVADLNAIINRSINYAPPTDS